MSPGPGSRSPRAPLHLLLALLALGAAAGCSAPPARLWPLDHDGLLPLAEVTAGSRVRQEGAALVVELQSTDDRVDSRGGHAVPASSLPVLELRLAFVGTPSRKLYLRVVPEGGEPAFLDVPLPASAPGEVVEATVALVRALGTGQRIDKVGLSIPGGGSFRVLSAEIHPLTLRALLSLTWGLLRDPWSYPPSVGLLAWGLAVLLLLSPWLVVRGVFALRGGVRTPSRAVTMLAASLAAAWFLVTLPSFERQLRGALDAVVAFRDVGPADLKKGALGLDGYAMAHLVDAGVAPDERIALFRGGRPSLASWRLIDSVAPRFTLNVACDALELPPGFPFGVALAGCLAEPVPIVAPPPSVPAARHQAAVAPREAAWILRGVAVALEKSSLDPGEGVSLAVRDGTGALLLEEELGGAPASVVWRALEVPARTALRLELAVSRASGEASVSLAPGGLQLFRLPERFVPLAWDPSGAILVSQGGTPSGAPRPVLTREESPSWSELPRLLLALALVVGVGEALLRAAFRGAEAPRAAERLALAWIAGAGVVTILWHLYQLLGLPAWPATLVTAAALAFAGLRAGRRDPVRPAAAFAPDEKAMAAGLAAMVLFAAIQAWYEPTRQWDELINWGYRAHVFHEAGPTTEVIRDYAALSPRHKAYPPGLPLVEAFVTRATGRWDEARASLPVALYYGAMGLLVFAAVRRTAGRRLALLYALLALLGPMARMMSHVGMADLPLGVVLLAALVSLDGWRGDAATRGHLLLAALCGALLSWVKLDGGALKLLVLGVAVLRALGYLRAAGAGRLRLLGDLGGAALLAFVPLAAWNHVYRSLELVDWVVNRGTLDPAYLRSKLVDVPEIVRALVGDLLVSDWGEGLLWGATYVFLAVMVVAAPWAFLRPATRAWTLAVVLGILGYGLIYVVSPQGLYQLERSLDRILLHYFPAAVVLAGRVHGELLPGRARASTGEGE